LLPGLLFDHPPSLALYFLFSSLLSSFYFSISFSFYPSLLVLLVLILLPS
jgi:hypothetical protein